MDARPARYTPAGFPRRAAAYFIDSFVVVLLWGLAFIVLFIVSLVFDPQGENLDAYASAFVTAMSILPLLYRWLGNCTGSGFGKRRMSLAVRRLSDGGRPGITRGLVRTVGQTLGAIPLGLGFWWAIWDGKKQAWHDKLAGTIVVRVERMPARDRAESRMPGWAPPWMRSRYAKYFDPLALDKALREPLPIDAASTPLEAALNPLPRPLYPLWLVAGIAPLLVFRFLGGFSLDLPTLLLIAGEILIVAAGGMELSGLNRSLRVSGDGIRLVKIYRTRTMPWLEIERVEAKPDLSSMRVVGRARRVSWDCRLIPQDKRKDIIVAIRARLPLGASIAEWPKERQLRTQAFRFGLNIAAVALFFAASVTGATGSYPGASASTRVLGLRCAVSSHYLRDRFGLPDERGCAVLRVSGPAKDSGLRQGDLMIAMDDIPITSGDQFSFLFEASDQDRFAFTVLRPGSNAPKDFVVEMGPGPGAPKEDSDEPLFYYLRARSDTERRHVEQDIDDFSRAIELAPDFDLAYLHRGELQWELGDRHAARQDFERALDLDPGLGEVPRHLAYVLIWDRDLEAARATVETAIALDECEGGFTVYNIDCAWDLELLAATYEYPDFQRGIEAAEKSIEFYSDFAEPYYQLAYFHHYLGHPEQAADYAQRYLSFPGAERDLDKSQQASDILVSE